MFTIYYYFMLFPEPLQKSLKLQPLHFTDQFYILLRTSFISADILSPNWDVFNNSSIFLYTLK
jgi:hypothetical protein